MKYLFLILCLCRMCWATCDGNVNAQYVLLPVGASDDQQPLLVSPDIAFIVGKTPETETTIDISWSGNDQHICGQKYTTTWENDTRFPPSHSFVRRPFLGIFGISGNISMTCPACLNNYIYFADTAVKEFGAQYRLFGEELSNQACRDQDWNWYYKYCICKNADCN